MKNDMYLTRPQAADYLGVSLGTLKNWEKVNMVHPTKVEKTAKSQNNYYDRAYLEDVKRALSKSKDLKYRLGYTSYCKSDFGVDYLVDILGKAIKECSITDVIVEMNSSDINNKSGLEHVLDKIENECVYELVLIGTLDLSITEQRLLKDYCKYHNTILSYYDVYQSKEMSSHNHYFEIGNYAESVDQIKTWLKENQNYGEDYYMWRLDSGIFDEVLSEKDKFIISHTLFPVEIETGFKNMTMNELRDCIIKIKEDSGIKTKQELFKFIMNGNYFHTFRESIDGVLYLIKYDNSLGLIDLRDDKEE